MGQYRNSKSFNIVAWLTVAVAVALTLAFTALTFVKK